MSQFAPFVSLKEIEFSYTPGKPVLRDVSFDIQPGSVNAILGPNGAGKSTLLHLILGLLVPQAGIISMKGQPLSSFSRGDLSRMVSLVPQRESVPFEYTVREYILLGRTPHLGYFDMPGSTDLQVVEKALQRLDLGNIAERKMNTLSGGEQQLVLIGRTLAQETRFLLLDEPTAHLDLGNKKRILSLLASLSQGGITILFTTHDPESASLVASSVILMKEGRILKQGALEKTFTSHLLSETYGTPLKVIDQDGQKIVLLNL